MTGVVLHVAQAGAGGQGQGDGGVAQAVRGQRGPAGDVGGGWATHQAPQRAPAFTLAAAFLMAYRPNTIRAP